MLKNLGEMIGKNKQNSAAHTANDHDDDRDLTTILSRSQRESLIELVAQLTVSMRDAIACSPMSPSPMAHTSSYPKDNKDPVMHQVTENAEVSDSLRYIDQGHAETSTEDLTLATDAFEYFDTWKDQVILRIGTAVNDKGSVPATERPIDSDLDNDVSLDTLDLSQRNWSSGKLHDVYPPADTPLARLPRAKKLLILHSILLLLLGLEHYCAHSRVLLLRLASSLELRLEDVNADEVGVARSLLDASVELSSHGYVNDKNSSSRKWKVGIASVAGAAIIGLTGGLAAPLVAAGVGTVMGGLGLGASAAAGYLGAVAGSSVVVGGLFGAYGGRMTGRTMNSYAREVEDFAFLPIHGPRETPMNEIEAARQAHRLRVTIGITGWATKEDDVAAPWRALGSGSEVFALRWELKSLLKLGNAINALVTSAGFYFLKKEIIVRTFFAELASAVSGPLSFLSVARMADNPFSVVKYRADKTGRVLSDALINRAQGKRPVTLIGYSFGSRVIFTCLRNFAERRAYGLIENVILIGSPVPSDVEHWRVMRSVVSGRLVNVFSENDAVLAFSYRTSSLQLSVAGLEPVRGLSGVENVDVSDLVSGHTRYQHLIGRILGILGLEPFDPQGVSDEEKALVTQDREEEKERMKNEREAEEAEMEQSAEPTGAQTPREDLHGNQKG